MEKLIWMRRSLRDQHTYGNKYLIWHGSYGYKCALYVLAKQDVNVFYYKPLADCKTITEAKKLAQLHVNGKITLEYPDKYRIERPTRKYCYLTKTIDYFGDKLGTVMSFQYLKEEF